MKRQESSLKISKLCDEKLQPRYVDIDLSFSSSSLCFFFFDSVFVSSSDLTVFTCIWSHFTVFLWLENTACSWEFLSFTWREEEKGRRERRDNERPCRQANSSTSSRGLACISYRSLRDLPFDDSEREWRRRNRRRKKKKTKSKANYRFRCSCSFLVCFISLFSFFLSLLSQSKVFPQSECVRCSYSQARLQKPVTGDVSISLSLVYLSVANLSLCL